MISANTTHPTEEALEQYALGRLPEPQAAPLEEHLLLCTPCQDRLREADEYVIAMRTALDDLRSEEQPVAVEKPSWLSRLVALPKPALVGAVAAIALLFLVLPGRQSGGDPYEVQLVAYRDAGQTSAQAPSGRPLILTLNLTGLPPAPAFRAEIADASGAPVFESDVQQEQEAATLDVSQTLEEGQYWVRVYAATGELLREFSLRIQ